MGLENKEERRRENRGTIFEDFSPFYPSLLFSLSLAFITPSSHPLLTLPSSSSMVYRSLEMENTRERERGGKLTEDTGIR